MEHLFNILRAEKSLESLNDFPKQYASQIKALPALERNALKHIWESRKRSVMGYHDPHLKMVPKGQSLEDEYHELRCMSAKEAKENLERIENGQRRNKNNNRWNG